MSIPLPRPPLAGPIPGMGTGGPLPPPRMSLPLPQPPGSPVGAPGGGLPLPPGLGAPIGLPPQPGVPMPSGPMGMGGGPMPPMGGGLVSPPGMTPGMLPPPPPPPNPLDDPIIMGLLRQKYEEEQEAERQKKGPFHPAWYEDAKDVLYPKPTLASVQQKATEDENRWRSTLDRFQEDIEYLSPRTEVTGVYRDFDKENEEAWFSSALVAEKNLIKAKVGGIDPGFEVESEYSSEKSDDVQTIEDFMYAADLEMDRQYTAATGSVRKLDLVDNALTYGRMVQRNLPDWNAEPGKVPFTFTLMDPATVFVTREGPRGIGTVTCIYVKTIRELLREHPECSKQIKNRLLRKKRDDAQYQLDDQVKCTEYWDRRWTVLVVEGELIKEPYEHDLGEPPFVYTLVPIGNAANVRSPLNRDATGRAGTNTANEQTDLRDQGVSFIQYRKRGHAQKERILAALDTQVRIKTNQPLIIEQDDFAMKNGMPDISGAAGARNQIWRGHEEAKPYPNAPMPGEFGPLLQASQEDLSRDAMPPSSYGLTQNPQQSGFAIESISESGGDKLTPIMLACEQFHTANMEQLLRFVLNWGHLLGKKGDRGRMKVRARNPRYGKTSHELTPYTIRQFEGCLNVTCKMTSLRLQNLAPLANALNLVRQGWGGITRYDAIKLSGLPGARNPIATMEEVDLEEAKAIPEYKLAKLFERMVEEGDETMAQFIWKQKMLAQAKEDAQNRQQTTPPGAAGGGGGPAMTPGMSLPGLGQPPGPGSGPQGPMGPRMMPPGMA